MAVLLSGHLDKFYCQEKKFDLKAQKVKERKGLVPGLGRWWILPPMEAQREEVITGGSWPLLLGGMCPGGHQRAEASPRRCRDMLCCGQGSDWLMPMLMPASVGAGNNPSCLSVPSPEALASKPKCWTEREVLNLILGHARKWSICYRHRSQAMERMISHPGYTFKNLMQLCCLQEDGCIYLCIQIC